MSQVENSAGSFEPARFASRLAAFTVDLVVGLPIGLALTWPTISEFSNERTTGFFIFLPVFIIKGYFQIKNGQSIGQKILKIKFVPVKYDSLTSAIIRNSTALVVMAIPGLNAVNTLFIIFSKSHQGLHDKIAHTYVIKVSQ